LANIWSKMKKKRVPLAVSGGIGHTTGKKKKKASLRGGGAARIEREEEDV